MAAGRREHSREDHRVLLFRYNSPPVAWPWSPCRGGGGGAQPLMDGSDENGRLITDREFVVPRRDSAVPLQAVDPALDRVTIAVVGRIETRGPTATRTKLATIASLIGLVRDGASDAAPAQVGTVLTGGVRLVGPHADRSHARPARPDPGHPDLLQHDLELRRVPTLPCRHHHRHGLLPLLDGQVQLGGEPAARTPQTVIIRLGEDAARRFLLQITLSSRPSRVLMGAAYRGIDAQLPDDRALRVSQGLEPGKDSLPGAVPLPPAKQVVNPAPRPVLGRDVPPRNTGPDTETYAVDQPPPRPDRWTPRPGTIRQQRLQRCPLPVRQISPPHEP